MNEPAASCSRLDRPSRDWDAFVSAQPQASVYLHSGWTQLAVDVFGHKACFIEARTADGALGGVLPVVRQRTLLSNFATSIPFFNYGGALAVSDDIASALMLEAQRWAESLGCSYLELRDARPHAGNWQVRTDKVSMVLGLPATFEALSKQLGSKLRSQVKRVDRENPVVRRGGAELLDAFYDVFARNMHELGTPVYPRRFFAAILERFASQCLLVVIERAGQPEAAAFLVIDGTRAEIPWAACREEAKPAGFNMKLYWEVLHAVVERGCTTFDFGRSTIDAGTYRFKKQWGAEPVQLYWHRWERSPRAVTPEGAAPGKARQIVTAAWRKLPLGVANTIGPWISPGLPW